MPQRVVVRPFIAVEQGEALCTLDTQSIIDVQEDRPKDTFVTVVCQGRKLRAFSRDIEQRTRLLPSVGARGG